MNKTKVKLVSNCTTCDCFNIIKNEYPELGGSYEVLHHSVFLQQLINSGRLKINGGGEFKGKTITFHDSCYLGRSNNIYEAPREILEALDADLVEMKSCKTNGLCCGAGGGHAWLEENQGTRINHMRTDQFLETGADTVAVSCPFCLQMFDEGLSSRDESKKRKAVDLIELIDQSTSVPQEKLGKDGPT